MTSEPAPTATVTVTAPPPAITVQLPPDTLDIWKDIVLTGDFMGALLGTLIAVAVSVHLFRRERADREEDSRQLRADRDADLARAEHRINEDRRTLMGNQLADAVSRLTATMTNFSHGGELRAASIATRASGVRVADLYADDGEHGPFAAWLRKEVWALHFKIMIVTSELDKPQEERDTALFSFLTSEIATDLGVLEKSIHRWLRGGPWEPDLQRRVEWLEEKAKMARTNSIPAVPNLNGHPIGDEQIALLKDIFMVSASSPGESA